MKNQGFPLKLIGSRNVTTNGPPQSSRFSSEDSTGLLNLQIYALCISYQVLTEISWELEIRL